MIQTLILSTLGWRRWEWWQMVIPKPTTSIPWSKSSWMNCPPLSSQHNQSAATTGDTSNEPPQLLLSPDIYLGWLDHICLQQRERQWDEPIIQRWYRSMVIQRMVCPALSALTMASCHLLNGWSVEDSWFLVMEPWDSACESRETSTRAMILCAAGLRTMSHNGDWVRGSHYASTMPTSTSVWWRWASMESLRVSAFWMVQERCRLRCEMCTEKKTCRCQISPLLLLIYHGRHVSACNDLKN